MENELVQAFNEMNETEYVTLDEIKKHFGEEEILDSYLKYEGISGYTWRILHAINLIRETKK